MAAPRPPAGGLLVNARPSEPRPAPDEDRVLLERIAGRDAEAFRILVERYQVRFHRVAIRILQDPSDAEDGVQLAFLRVYRRAGEYRSDWAGSTWLYRVLTNVCIDAWRKRRRRVEIGEAQDVESAAAPEAGSAERAVAERLDLERGLARLSPEAKLVFLLRHSEDLSYEEIARVRGVSVNTVKTQLARARRTMRALLKGDSR